MTQESNDRLPGAHFTDTFDSFDQQLSKRKAEKERLEKDLNENYLTFLEKWVKKSRLNPFLFSFLLSLVFLLIFEDFSFFISIFIGIVTIVALTTMRYLRDFVVNLIQLSDMDENDTKSQRFRNILRKSFIDFKLVPFGLFFGAVNVALSYAFGIHYLHQEKLYYLLTASIIFQYFVAGFICGLCIGGIVIVTRLIAQLDFKNEIKLDYFYPDRCAGTLIMGKILFNFAIYTIFVGILIFVYVHTTPWMNEDDTIIQYLILFWKIFPFVMAAIVFFFPVFSINRHLRNYKYFEQLRVRKRLSYLNELILNMDVSGAQNEQRLEQINTYYEKLERVDGFIDQMNTWPYNLSYRTAFISLFLPAVIGIATELSTLVISGYLQEMAKN